MSDSDRGAYAPPTDPPLSFDARQPVRGARPAPLTLIISGIVLLLLVAAIVMFYRSGVREAGQAPETVGSPVGPLRGPAPAEEQPTDPAAGLQIYQTEAGKAAAEAPKFTPPPEAPAARPAPTAAIAPPAALPPVTALPKAAPAPTAAALKPAVPAPAPPKVAEAAPPPPKPAPAAPVAAAKPAPAAAAAGGAAAVQIGAFSSLAEADKGWNDAVRVAPGATAGKGKKVEPVDRNGATLYRTLVTGFPSKATAAAFCGQLKAAGKSCFVK